MDKSEARRLVKRQITKNSLRSEYESSLDARVSRYLEIEHHWITGAHHFAKASAECLHVYRDGHYIATVMMSHSLNEAIIEFVAERNHVTRDLPSGNTKAIAMLIDELAATKTISSSCSAASKKIYGSYRNDIHHLSPVVASIDFQALAKQNISLLAVIEKEIFGVDVVDGGTLRPHQPKYWDIRPDGTVSAYIRLD